MGDYVSQLVDINGMPLLACLVVSGILVYLGMHVVERKVIFVDLALAQIAALGVMWAILMGYDHEKDTLATTLYSLSFTAIGALVFSLTRTKSERVPHEALIGIIYVTATAGGLVLADRFALGTEALKELIAGRVALVTPDMVGKLAITCAVMAAVFVALHKRFMRISRDPAGAEAAGLSIRIWDFIFYTLFGSLITQCVSVLGVLPVFAYLVIPAVAGAFLFDSIKTRLIFGWGFAALVSLVGLETARLERLDPGPTIVCLFAAALILLGVVLFLRSKKFELTAVMRVLGFAALFAAFLLGTCVFKKAERTDELATAIEFAKSGDATKQRQAMESFRRFPNARARWVPLVVGMLEQPDRVARDAAVTLLADTKATEAVEALAARLGKGVEPEDDVRENIVRALRTIGDPRATHALADAATREIEPDIAIEMVEAAFELAGGGDEAELRTATDVLVQTMADDGAPDAARRDAADALRAHVDCPKCRDETEALEWWKAQREQLRWHATDHRFVMP